MSSDQSPRSTASNAAWATTGTFVSIAVSFVTAPVIIKGLGTSSYGLYVLIGSFLGILGIMNFGLGEATLRYVAKHHANEDPAAVNRVFGATLSFYCVIALATLLFVWTQAPFLVEWFNLTDHADTNVEVLFRIASGTFALSIVSSTFGVVPSALRRFDIGTKMGVGVLVTRTTGTILLVFSGFGLVEVVTWDFSVTLLAMVVWIVIAKRLLPGLNPWPTLDFGGLRETVGYSVFAFLTWLFHTAHRESGKLILARLVGTAPVGYLGAPDAIAQRLHTIISSASEALLPRFSVDPDSDSSALLFLTVVWAGIASAIMIFVPFIVLVPEFLALWIDAEFAAQSGLIGQLIGVYLIFQTAFTPIAAFYRGVGKPWFVTLVILGSLVLTVGAAIVLVPDLGAEGAGYAYLIGSAAPFIGSVIGAIRAFPSAGVLGPLRTLFTPMLAGAASLAILLELRPIAEATTWFRLVGFGAISLATTVGLVLAADWFTSGEQGPARTIYRLILRDKLARFGRSS